MINVEASAKRLYALWCVRWAPPQSVFVPWEKLGIGTKAFWRDMVESIVHETEEE